MASTLLRARRRPTGIWIDSAGLDSDGIGDACDADEDGDGVFFPAYSGSGFAEDNCPRVSNKRQWDTDKDGIGDRCEEELSETFWGMLSLPDLLAFHDRMAGQDFSESESMSIVSFLESISPQPADVLAEQLDHVAADWVQTKASFIEHLGWMMEEVKYEREKSK